MNYEVLLLNVIRDYGGYSNHFQDSIGQYLIAAYLRQRNFAAKVFSGSIDDCIRVLEKEVGGGHVGVVGFYAAADNIRVVSHAVQWIKKNYQATTIIGGPQAIALDAVFFQKTGNDYAIVGEGEIPVYHLLSYLIDHIGKIDEIPSLKFWIPEENRLVWNQCETAIVEDLDEIPWPHQEDSLTGQLRQGRTVGIITGRGCPNRCSFCYEGANAKRVRFRSIPNVMAEIDYIREHNPHVEYINVYDDTFTLRVDRVLAFSQEMKKRNLKWFCEGHVSFVVQNPEALKIMVDSGLTCIQFGIESASQAVLEAYRKNTNREMILQGIKICKEAGIHGITGNFIIGGAMETRETIAESKRLAEELLDTAKGIIELRTVYFAPYPNTRMTRVPREFDMEIDSQLQEWNVHTMHSPVVRTAALSTADIYEQKQQFDKFLSDRYMASARASRKADVLQGLTHDGKRIYINPTWENTYRTLPYIDVFLRHLSEREQCFAAERYPIRTFEDYVLREEVLHTEAGDFTGTERDLLLYATGIYTAQEIADLLNMQIEEMKQAFLSLNNRCLLYMSQW